MDESKSTPRVPADYNLKNWSTIAYAASLWNKSNITPFFDTANQTESFAYIKKMVKEKEKTLKWLPSQILNRILCTFMDMGQRIALWCRFAEIVLLIPRNLAVTIHWTIDGAIDEGRILRSSKIYARNKYSEDKRLFYYTICANVHIDYINDNWEEMLKFYYSYQRSCPSPAKIKFEFIINSVIFLAKLTFSQLSNHKIRGYNGYDYSQKKNMFLLSVEEGCDKAACYYWSLLEEEDKQMELIRVATDSSSTCYIKNRGHDSFKKQGNPCDKKSHDVTECVFFLYKSKSSADLLIHFMKHLSEVELNHYFTAIIDFYFSVKVVFNILDIFMYHSPLEELLPTAYQIIFKHCEAQIDCYDMVIKILEAMDRNKKMGLCNKQKFHRKIFIAAWGKLRIYTTFKEILDSEDLITSIYDLFDLDILNFIINTDCEDEHRKFFLEIGKTKFKTLVENEEYELLQKFANDVLQSEDERKWFKTVCFEFFGALINQLKFGAVDKLLQFAQCATNQDLVIYTCERFICHNPTPLKSTFNSEEDNQNFRKNWLVSNPSWVVFLWEKHEPFSENNFADYIPKFLRWVLKSKSEVMRFETRELTNQDYLKNLFAVLFRRLKDGSQVFYVVDELLSYCTSAKTIKIKKRKIRRNVSAWITFLSRECCLHCVDDFLNWIFKSVETKEKVIEAYLREKELGLSETEDKNRCGNETAKTSYDIKNRTRLRKCRRNLSDFKELGNENDFWYCKYMYSEKSYISRY